MRIMSIDTTYTHCFWEAGTIWEGRHRIIWQWRNTRYQMLALQWIFVQCMEIIPIWVKSTSSLRQARKALFEQFTLQHWTVNLQNDEIEGHWIKRILHTWVSTRITNKFWSLHGEITGSISVIQGGLKSYKIISRFY